MRLRTVLSALVVATVTTTVQIVPGSASVSPNLVVFYKFDADSTTVIRDYSTNDLSGRLVSTDPSSNFVKGAPGKKRALSLHASARQYVSVPESSVLDLDRFTIAAWISYTGVVTGDTLDRWEVMEKAGAYWLNVRTNGRIRAGGFFGGCASSKYWTYVDSTESISVNTWTHVAATYNGTRLTVYINGKVSGALPVSGTTCSNDEPLAVGAKNAPAKGILEAFWDGRLDDVRLYNKSLTATRVAALATGG